MLCQVKNLKAKIIENSRRGGTIEVELETEKGVFKASVPAGVSTGQYEAKSLSPKEAALNVNKIVASALVGKKFTNQKELDDFLIKLDGTVDKSRLGANAILAVSIAFFRANPISDVGRQILPRMCFNILEGGKHTKSNLDIQEFMVAPNFGSAKENLKAGQKIQQALGKILKRQFGEQGIVLGDEGGFAPMIVDSATAMALLWEAIEQAGCQKKTDIVLDCAASEFFKKGKYHFEGEVLDGEELGKIYQQLIKHYPIILIEDPFSQNDTLSWASYKSQITSYKCTVMGDDLTVTNPKRIKMAKQKQLCDAVIIKPNQIGTVSETIEAAELAKKYGWKIIVSHRAGETEDDFIADLAVLLGADFIKSGAPGPVERMAKYNRLLEIERGQGRVRDVPDPTLTPNL